MTAINREHRLHKSIIRAYEKQFGVSGTDPERLLQFFNAENTKMDSIKRLIKNADKRIEAAKAECAKQIKTAREAVEKLQKICPHHDITYHPDASGNSDSYEECNTCGYIAKDIKREY